MEDRPRHGIPADAWPSEPIDAPSSLGAVVELRAAAQLPRLGMRLPRLALRRGRANRRAVMVIPGIHATDSSTLALRRYLAWLGHDVVGWGLGRNRARLEEDIEALVERLESLVADDGRRRTLVGWSLGGLISREIARRRPDLVEQVVTYGTPVVGGAQYTIFAARFREQGDRANRGGEHRDAAVPRPVTVIYSRADRVVSWRACIDHESEDARHVEVRSTHVGMGLDPDVWHAVADALAQPQASRRAASRGAIGSPVARART